MHRPDLVSQVFRGNLSLQGEDMGYPDDESDAMLRAQICEALRADHSSASLDAAYFPHSITALSAHQSAMYCN